MANLAGAVRDLAEALDEYREAEDIAALVSLGNELADAAQNVLANWDNC